MKWTTATIELTDDTDATAVEEQILSEPNSIVAIASKEIDNTDYLAFKLRGRYPKNARKYADRVIDSIENIAIVDACNSVDEVTCRNYEKTDRDRLRVVETIHGKLEYDPEAVSGSELYRTAHSEQITSDISIPDYFEENHSIRPLLNFFGSSTRWK